MTATKNRGEPLTSPYNTCEYVGILKPEGMCEVKLQPIYSPGNCEVAYQLNWSLSLFGKHCLPSPDPVIDELQSCVSRDNLKLLEYRSLGENVVQFFVSAQPQHSPAAIVKSIKGRWKNVARERDPVEFRRNYHIRSVGSAKSRVLDSYIEKQTMKHPMADSSVQTMLESLQFVDPNVDIAAIQKSAHGQFLNTLHFVFEHNDGWRETQYEVLAAYRSMIISACKKQEWLLSRIGLLSNHIHVLLSAGVAQSPEEIALSLLNNLAFTQQMKPVFKHSYYVGSFGEFDRGAIWNALAEDNVSEGREAFAIL